MKTTITFFKILIHTLSVLFYYSILLLPLKIWLDSYKYLQHLFKQDNYIKQFLNSEIKVFSWIPLFLNCLIFLMYPLGITLIISLFFKGFTFDYLKSKLIFLIFVSYFGPLLLALVKEMMNIMLLKYFKIENIEDLLNNIQKTADHIVHKQ